jgi:hypothetical protein
VTTPQVHIDGFDTRQLSKGDQFVINNLRSRGCYIITMRDGEGTVHCTTRQGRVVFTYDGWLVGSAEIAQPNVRDELKHLVVPDHLLVITLKGGGRLRLYVHTVEMWSDATKSRLIADRRKVLQNA